MILHGIDPDHLSGGAIAGIVIGVLVVLGLALVGSLFHSSATTTEEEPW